MKTILTILTIITLLTSCNIEEAEESLNRENVYSETIFTSNDGKVEISINYNTGAEKFLILETYRDMIDSFAIDASQAYWIHHGVDVSPGDNIWDLSGGEDETNE